LRKSAKGSIAFCSVIEKIKIKHFDCCPTLSVSDIYSLVDFSLRPVAASERRAVTSIDSKQRREVQKCFLELVVNSVNSKICTEKQNQTGKKI
jgi:hypothetical protein